ncbi:MAG: c-type cytochrome domain-containing protein, partial [Vicinamibacterales bacterium]
MIRDSVVGVLCAGLFASVGSVEIVGQEERTAAEHRAVLDRYCVTCHNDRLRTGNLSLDSIDSENVSLDASTWEKVLQKMQTQSMPPPGRPRPDTETYDAFASW